MNSPLLDQLRAALDRDDDSFLAAMDEIRRLGPDAAPLVPDLAKLVDDSKTVIVPTGRPPAEMESDHTFISRGELVIGPLAAIGEAAVSYLLDRYRSGENRGRWAGAIAAMGEPGLAATLTILRDIEWVRGKLMFNLRASILADAKYDKLRELMAVIARSCTKEFHALIFELDCLTVPILAANPSHQPSPTSRPAGDEQAEFTVVLTACGENKISVIKEVRGAVPFLGLKEANDLVGAAPQILRENISEQAAEAMRKNLEAVGASVQVTRSVSK